MGNGGLTANLRRRPQCQALRAIVVLTPLLGTLVAGCNGPRGIEAVPPRDAREAMQRINDNLARIEGALYCPARASFRFRDANGHDRRFLYHPATVVFERPRCLYYDIKSSIGGSVARIGSNDERYWLWIDTPETHKLWHGTWEALEEGRARPLAIPPSQLLDVLMMRPLSLQLPDGLKPLLETDGKQRRLLFIELDEGGWPHVRRELLLDPRPPYMPIEIIDRLGDGRVAMRAYLKGYKPVRGTGPDGPYTARRYAVYWETNEAEMRLDFRDVRYRTKELPFCEFPGAWEGEIELLDQPADAKEGETVQEGVIQS